MPRSQAMHTAVGFLPPASNAASLWKAARRHLIDLIPFISMMALVTFIIIDNARG